MSVNEDYLRLLLNEAIAELTAKETEAHENTRPGWTEAYRNENRGKRAAYHVAVVRLTELKRKLELP